ncbi:hypothetical protein LXL04_016014 [Taraxacum kok-saghyz]
MAKKKTKQLQSEENIPPTTQHEIPRQTTDDAASEKLDSLKSLNAMLLKETVERRHQVDSLTQTNSSLESELNRCKSDKVSLESEFSGLTERAMMLEIEKESASRFVALQLDEMTNVNRRERAALEEKIEGLVREMNRVSEEKNAIEEEKNKKESEIGSLNGRLNSLVTQVGEEKFAFSKVCEERDGIKAQLHDRIQYEKGLRSKLTEAEKREAEITENSLKVKAAYVDLVEEKKLTDRKVDSILKDKDLVEMNLAESNRLVDVLKRDIEKMMKEKMETDDDRDVQERKKNELHASVHNLNELVYKLKKGEEQLVTKVADLEKKHAMDSEKEAKMSIEIDVLVKEKQEIEAGIQKLTQEKSLVSKDLNEALKMIEHQKLTINQMLEEKTKITEQSAKFKNTIATLENSNKVQVNKIKQLETEISNHKAAFDKARANLDEEKLKLKNSNEKISKMDKSIEETRKKLSKMTTESEKLVAEKNKLAESLAKTRKEHDDTKAKLKLSEAKKNQILKILKATNIISSSKEDDHIDQEIKKHATEVEAVKKAIKDKESLVEEQKKQLELLMLLEAADWMLDFANPNRMTIMEDGVILWVLIKCSKVVQLY